MRGDREVNASGDRCMRLRDCDCNNGHVHARRYEEPGRRGAYRCVARVRKRGTIIKRTMRQLLTGQNNCFQKYYRGLLVFG